MRVSMIVAIGKKGQLGKDNQLLWHIPEDLKMFKEITSNHHIIMGRKTFESIGKPLPNRTSIVLSNSGFKHEGVFTCKDINEALELCRKRGESEAFIIGGGKVYNSTLNMVDRLYLSKVYYDGEADVFFPRLIIREWLIIEEINHKEQVCKDGKTIPAWQFCILEKINMDKYKAKNDSI